MSHILIIEAETYGDWLVIGCGRLFDHRPHEGCPGESAGNVPKDEPVTCRICLNLENSI